MSLSDLMACAALRAFARPWCQVKDLRKQSLSKNKPASGGNFQDSLLKLVRTLPKAPLVVHLVNKGDRSVVIFFDQATTPLLFEKHRLG